MESATSGQSATSQCLSALPGWLGRGKFVLDGLRWKERTSAPITLLRRLRGDSAPLVVINTAVTSGGKEFHSRGGGGPARKDQPPKKKKSRIRPRYSNWETLWIGYGRGSEVGKGEYT